MIKEISLSDIDDVVSVHMQSLPQDIFPLLGKNFLTRFYSAALQSDYCMILGFYQETRLQGFIFLTTQSDKVIPDIISKNFFGIMKSAISGVIKNVSLLKGLVWNSARMFFSRKKNLISSAIGPEIFFIVVRSDSRSKNIGSALIDQAKSFFVNRGYHQMKVKTLKYDNGAVIEFYKKNGGEILEEFIFFERTYLYLKFELILSDT